MNCLMLSVGRRGELLKEFRNSMEPGARIIATDNSPYAPALYFADKQYIVPRIDTPDYIDNLLDICRKEKINMATTLIDPEIMILADNKRKFESLGVTVLAPGKTTAEISFDKFKMFRYLTQKKINTVRTWGSLEELEEAIREKQISFPVFVKPRTGSGSVGARKISDMGTLEMAFSQDSSLIAQEMMEGEGILDIDADVYVDTVLHKPVAIFSKKKIAKTIGGANKTISFKDEKLFAFIPKILENFEFNGPIDMDFFYKDSEYYLSEINPRFGGAYLHAYSAGVDFIKLIEKNIKGEANHNVIGDYEDGIVMMMYDSVVVGKQRGEGLLEVRC